MRDLQGQFSVIFIDFPRLLLDIFKKQKYYIGDRKGTTKKLCDKDFAERSGELSGAICLKTLVLMGMTGNPLELFRKFFGAVRAIFWLCESFLVPDNIYKEFVHKEF